MERGGGLILILLPEKTNWEKTNLFLFYIGTHAAVVKEDDCWTRINPNTMKYTNCAVYVQGYSPGADTGFK